MDHLNWPEAFLISVMVLAMMAPIIIVLWRD